MGKRGTQAMRSALILVTAVGLALVLAGCPEKKVVVKPQEPVKKVVRVKPAEETFNEGLDALAAKDVERGLSLMREAMAKKPDNVRMQVVGNYNLGAVAMAKGDLPAAEAAFQAVLKADELHKAALLDLGVLLKRQKKYKEAIQHYTAALAKLPRDPEIMNNLIVVYRLDKQYAEAEKTGHKLLARSPTNVEAYKNLTLIYYDQGKYEMAELLCINAGKMLEKLRAKDPSVPEDAGIFNNLGMIYVGMKRYRDALAQFDKALKIQPEYVEALVNLAAIAHRFRDYDKALAAYDQVLKLDPGNAIAQVGRAYAIFGNGDGKAALPLFEALLAKTSDDALLLWNVAAIYDEQIKDYAKAIEFYNKYKAAKGSALKADDPVSKKIATATQKLEMATEMKKEQEEEDRKAAEEEAKKKKALEEAKKETSAEGKQKLEDMLKAGDESTGQPPPEGDKAAPPPEGDKAAPPPEGDKAAPPPEGDKAAPPSAPGEPGTARGAEGDKPAEPAKTDGDKPAEPAKTDGDKPAEPAKTDGDKPAEPAKTDGDKPAEPAKDAEGDKPAEPAEPANP
jgi:tetratricopeptide (TPR) repeat protein